MAGSLRPSRHPSGVLELELHRPHRLNALDGSLITELVSALRSPVANCVLLNGTGRSFSAGYDLHSLDADALSTSADGLVSPIESPLLAAVDACPVPIVAAVQGDALGGGLDLLLGCDLVLAADDARFGYPANRIGLVYSQAALVRLVRAVGPARSRHLLLTGEPVDATPRSNGGSCNRWFLLSASASSRGVPPIESPGPPRSHSGEIAVS